MQTDDLISFQTARARIAHTALAHYTRVQLLERLQLLGASPSHLVEPLMTDRSLAYQLAWRLLPAGAYRADGGKL